MDGVRSDRFPTHMTSLEKLEWKKYPMSTLVLERPKEAISIYDEPLAVKTDEDEAWFNWGIVLINLGQFEEAIASFDKVLEIQPNLYEVWYNRGLALLKLGRLDEAFS